MDKPPHDDGGPAFPYDIGMNTGSETGTIHTDVHAHAGISLADLIAALVAMNEEGNVRARAKEGYEVADALIQLKRAREQRVSDHWQKHYEEQQVADQHAKAEKIVAMQKRSDG